MLPSTAVVASGTSSPNRASGTSGRWRLDGDRGPPTPARPLREPPRRPTRPMSPSVLANLACRGRPSPPPSSSSSSCRCRSMSASCALRDNLSSTGDAARLPAASPSGWTATTHSDDPSNQIFPLWSCTKSNPARVTRHRRPRSTNFTTCCTVASMVLLACRLMFSLERIPALPVTPAGTSNRSVRICGVDDACSNQNAVRYVR